MRPLNLRGTRMQILNRIFWMHKKNGFFDLTNKQIATSMGLLHARNAQGHISILAEHGVIEIKDGGGGDRKRKITISDKGWGHLPADIQHSQKDWIASQTSRIKGGDPKPSAESSSRSNPDRGGEIQGSGGPGEPGDLRITGGRSTDHGGGDPAIRGGGDPAITPVQIDQYNTVQYKREDPESTPGKLWITVREDLQSVIPAPFFHQFIEPISVTPHAVGDKGPLLLTIPGEKLLRHIEARYYPIILASLKKVGFQGQVSLTSRKEGEAA